MAFCPAKVWEVLLLKAQRDQKRPLIEIDKDKQQQ